MTPFAALFWKEWRGERRSIATLAGAAALLPLLGLLGAREFAGRFGLQRYAYDGPHAVVLRRRHEWFEKLNVYVVLWWLPAGPLPTVEPAQERLTYLPHHGPPPRGEEMRDPALVSCAAHAIAACGLSVRWLPALVGVKHASSAGMTGETGEMTEVTTFPEALIPGDTQ